MRILLGKIQTLAKKNGRSIEPLLSYSEGHHLRVFLRVVNERNITLKWLNNKMEVSDSEVKDSAGPIWLENIINPEFIPDKCEGQLGKFFEILNFDYFSKPM